MRFKAKVIQGWQGVIEGEVLITKMRISFLGDIDQQTGTIVGNDLDIKEQKITGKIFIFSESRGSTVGSNVLYGLAKKTLGPKLLGTHRAELITISGAIYGEIPMVSDIPLEVFEVVKNGTQLRAFIIDNVAYLEA